MVEIDKKLYNDIKLYCQANDFVVKDFLNKLIRKAFTIEKYGGKPFSNDDDLIVARKKKETEPLPKVVYSPYVLDDTPQVVLTPETINSELPENIKERFNKPVSNRYYENITVDGLVNETGFNVEKIEEPKVEKKSKKRKL